MYHSIAYQKIRKQLSDFPRKYRVSEHQGVLRKNLNLIFEFHSKNTYLIHRVIMGQGAGFVDQALGDEWRTAAPSLVNHRNCM